ncbi:juvenile hormone acid O-methyltransferase [Ostrinia nubilalis]|uniref:juvenile hormone acid O-methyltransferase n=1 Tax=Ostrinia nubilalis TaxID=29057 RepID=UPI0030825DB7
MHTYAAPAASVRRKRARLSHLAHAQPTNTRKIQLILNMNNAELYQGNNTLQKRDAIDCLEEFANKIRWKRSGERIIDIGCGDGSVTVKLLREYVPDNFEKLLGCDISEKMVAFANLHHKDERTDFTVLDIERKLPKDLRNAFDHVFSFYTLHWIKDQELAFENIFDLLTPGGECLLSFLGHNPVFDVYRILAQSNKWSSWLRGVDRFISPYHESQEPEKEIWKMMNKIGFNDISVKCQEKIFIYNSPESVKKAVQAVNPFPMPKDVFDDFMLDYVDVLRDMKLIDESNNNKPASIRTNYKLIVVYGSK